MPVSMLLSIGFHRYKTKQYFRLRKHSYPNMNHLKVFLSWFFFFLSLHLGSRILNVFITALEELCSFKGVQYRFSCWGLSKT